MSMTRDHLIALYLGSASAIRRRPTKFSPPVCGVRQPERGAADGAKAGGLFPKKENKNENILLTRNAV